MVHETEYICKEFTNMINERAAKINETLGRDAVKVDNSEELDSCINIYFDGKVMYLPATEEESDAYLCGILVGLEENKKQANETAINISLTAEESSIFGYLITHLFEQSQISNIHLYKQEKDLLIKIHKDIVFQNIHKTKIG